MVDKGREGNTQHSGQQGGHRRAQLYDFWLNSILFRCKNHFCSLETGGYKYFWTQKYFSYDSLLYPVKASSTV